MKISRDLAKLTLAWIVNETNFHKKVPKLIYSKKQSTIYGSYVWENETITVYEQPHLNLRKEPLVEFIDTILHEFAHHRQNKTKVLFKRLNKSVSGFHHQVTTDDLENEAEAFSRKYTKKLLKIINQK